MRPGGWSPQKRKGHRDALRYENYYDATNGNNLNLTIDASIQYYCERILDKGIEMFDAKRRLCHRHGPQDRGHSGLWANSPTYDLNSPSAVNSEKTLAELETIKNTYGADSDEYKEALGNAQLSQWRNKAINDTYEPRFTFKIHRLAAALRRAWSTSDSLQLHRIRHRAGPHQAHPLPRQDGHGTRTWQGGGKLLQPSLYGHRRAAGRGEVLDYMEDFGFPG